MSSFGNTGKKLLIYMLICCIIIFTAGCRLLLPSPGGRSFYTTMDGLGMLPTLTHNERVSVKELNDRMPVPGDIIAFNYSMGGVDDIEFVMIKRVIAIEGQTIDINFDTGEVFVDGLLLNEPYINEPTRVRLDFEGPVTVPDGHVFVMGDNRNSSTDSRYGKMGFIDAGDIIGIVN